MVAGRLSQHIVGSSFPAEASKPQSGRRMLWGKARGREGDEGCIEVHACGCVKK